MNASDGIPNSNSNAKNADTEISADPILTQKKQTEGEWFYSLQIDENSYIIFVNILS